VQSCITINLGVCDLKAVDQSEGGLRSLEAFEARAFSKKLR